MDWPAEEDVIPAPPAYEALEGYPGVYVCVEVGAKLHQTVSWLLVLFVAIAEGKTTSRYCANYTSPHLRIQTAMTGPGYDAEDKYVQIDCDFPR